MDELTKILNAADSLFRKYGIRSVTMSDIAKQLGMSKKTLYVHIENKHDLVAKMMKRHIEQDRRVCLEIQITAKNALDGLLKVNLYVQEQVKDINPSLLFDLQKYHHPVWEMCDEFHRKDLVHMVEQNLKRGVEEGLYRADIHVPLVSRLYVGMFPIISDVELFPIHQFPTHTLHKEFIQYHIHGIVSDKGKALLDDMLNSIDPKGDIH